MVEEVCGPSKRAMRQPYHGLSDEERQHNQDDFIYDRKRIMVATNSFGMGIDKSDALCCPFQYAKKILRAGYQESWKGWTGWTSFGMYFVLFGAGCGDECRVFIQPNEAEASLLI